MKNYFHLANSFVGDVYFEVSKHLSIPISEVIKKKFTFDIKFLIIKYSQILRNKQKEYEEFQDKLDK